MRRHYLYDRSVSRKCVVLLVVKLVIFIGDLWCSADVVINGDNKFHRPNGAVGAVVVPVSQRSRGHTTTNFTYWDTPYGGEVAAYLVVTNEAWSVVAPCIKNDTTTISGSKSGFMKNRHRRGRYNNRVPPKFATTAAQALANNCNIAATNGGPYNKDGISSGPLVMRGELQTPNDNNTKTSYIGFGITKPNNEGRQHWALGSYSQIMEEIIDTTLPPLWDFVTGFNWLVYDGIPIANNSNNPTGAYQAARTVIGLDYDSNLFLLVVDGCERCINLKKRGLTLENLADLLANSKHVHSKYAINMDGGGSTTMVRSMRHVVNRPTCLDIPLRCQRPVATVHCISSSHITIGTLTANPKEV